MIAVAILFLLSIVAFWIGALVTEGTIWAVSAYVLLMVSFVVLTYHVCPDTSDKGYNVWKSYTISGNDTTNVTWHVVEKK